MQIIPVSENLLHWEKKEDKMGLTFSKLSQSHKSTSLGKKNWD